MSKLTTCAYLSCLREASDTIDNIEMNKSKSNSKEKILFKYKQISFEKKNICDKQYMQYLYNCLIKRNLYNCLVKIFIELMSECNKTKI